MSPGMALFRAEGQSPWVGQWGISHWCDSSIWSETCGPCQAVDYVIGSLGTLVTTQPLPTVSEWCTLSVIVWRFWENWGRKKHPLVRKLLTGRWSKGHILSKTFSQLHVRLKRLKNPKDSSQGAFRWPSAERVRDGPVWKGGGGKTEGLFHPGGKSQKEGCLTFALAWGWGVLWLVWGSFPLESGAHV